MGSDKKRRRSKDAEETRPAKKAKVEKIKMKVLPRENDHAAPLIVEFPRGPPPLHAFGEQGAAFQLEARPSHLEDLREQRKLVVETLKMKYTATNFGESMNNHSSYFIGVYNKKTGDLKMVPVPQVFRAKQHVKACEWARVATEGLGYQSDVVARKHEGLAALETRQLLINKFASSRKRTRVARRNENRIQDSYMVGMTDRVGNTLQAMEERAKEEIQTVRRDLPSYSTTATKTRKIYDVESIISSRNFNILKESTTFQGYIASAETLKSIPETLPKIVRERLVELFHKTDMKQSVKDTYCWRLQYLAYMIAFSKIVHASRRYRANGYADSGIQQDVWRTLLSQFTEVRVSNGRTSYHRATGLQTALIRHICVLALITSADFSVPVATLARDMDIKSAILTVHFQQCGCQIGVKRDTSEDTTKTNRRTLARLRAPLSFPPITVKKFNRR